MLTILRNSQVLDIVFTACPLTFGRITGSLAYSSGAVHMHSIVNLLHFAAMVSPMCTCFGAFVPSTRFRFHRVVLV